jgi:hypothetical protein
MNFPWTTFNLSKSLKQAGITDTIKLFVIPKENDVLFFRLENLADLDSGVGAVTVDMKKVASAFEEAAKSGSYQEELELEAMNILSGRSTATIVETSITGNMRIDEMRARKLQWKTAD